MLKQPFMVLLFATLGRMAKLEGSEYGKDRMTRDKYKTQTCYNVGGSNLLYLHAKLASLQKYKSQNSRQKYTVFWLLASYLQCKYCSPTTGRYISYPQYPIRLEIADAACFTFSAISGILSSVIIAKVPLALMEAIASPL